MELLVSLINVRQFLPFYKLLVESYLVIHTYFSGFPWKECEIMKQSVP